MLDRPTPLAVSITLTQEQLMGPSPHLLVMGLRPFDPLPSASALRDGRLKLTITKVHHSAWWPVLDASSVHAALPAGLPALPPSLTASP